MLQVIQHVVVLVALHFVSPNQLLSMLQLVHFSPVCEFLVDAHTTRRLQQIAVSCKRSDKNKKTCKVSLLSSFVKKPPKRVAPFYDAALARAQMCLTFKNFMGSTRNRSTATMMCWMKKTTDAISGIARKEGIGASRSSPDSR